MRLEPFLDSGGELVDGFDAGDTLDKLCVPNSVKIQLVGLGDLIGL